MQKKIWMFLGLLFIGVAAFICKPEVDYSKDKDVYVEIDGWPMRFHYLSEKNKLVNDEKSFKILRHTENTLILPDKKGTMVFQKLIEVDDEYELLGHHQITDKTKKNVAVITLVTDETEALWEKFYSSVEKNFLPRHEKQYYVFTNNKDLTFSDNVIKVSFSETNTSLIKMKRFHHIGKIKKLIQDFDYVYFMDVTVNPVSEVKEEVFPTEEQQIVFALEPFYFRKPLKEISPDRQADLLEYISSETFRFYVSGAFFGGTAKGFLRLSDTIKKWAEDNFMNDVVSKWSDENYLNKYLVTLQQGEDRPLILTPEYLLPEDNSSISLEFLPYKKMTYKPVDDKQKEKTIFQVFENQDIYEYDEKTNKLKSQNEELDVVRKTGNTFSVQTDKGLTIFHRIYYTKDKYEALQKSMVTDKTSKKIAVVTIMVKDAVADWKSFYVSAEKNLLPGHTKNYFVFTDAKRLFGKKKVHKIFYNPKSSHQINNQKFHLIDGIKDKLKTFDYVYFVNAQSIVKQPVYEDVFPTKEQQISVVLHPWHYRWEIEKFPHDRRRKSKAYVPYSLGVFYVQNNFFGGLTDGFLKMIDTLKNWTDENAQKGIEATWHDESMLNAYVYHHMKNGFEPLVLTPEYMYPDEKCPYSLEFEAYQKMTFKSQNTNHK